MDFFLSFENEGDRKVHRGFYLTKVEIKDYTVMIDEKTFLISRLKIILEYIVIFKKSKLAKEMIMRQIVY